MGYIVKLDVVTNKEGLDTLSNHEGFAGLIREGYVTATKIDDVLGGIYHLNIAEIKYSWIMHEKIMEAINSLPYYECVSIGEEMDDLEYEYNWPDNVTGVEQYLFIRREAELYGTKLNEPVELVGVNNEREDQK